MRAPKYVNQARNPIQPIKLFSKAPEETFPANLWLIYETSSGKRRKKWEMS